MIHTKKVMTALGCILMAAILCFGGCAEKEEGLKKVKVGEVTHSVFYAPQYAAIALGYFEEEGLELELSNLQGADKVMTAVLSNQIDIGFCGPEAAIYVYNEGKEDYVEVFAQMTKRDGSFLVGKDPDDNFDWNDIRGKTVIPGRKGGVPYMTLEYVVKQNGIDPVNDVNLDDSIQFSLMAGAFAGSDAEYVSLFEPTASMIEAEGKGHILCSIGEESGEIPYTAYCAKKSFIKENDDMIQKFTNAIYRGQKWVEENTAADIANKISYAFPDTDINMLTKSVESYKSIGAWNLTPYLEEKQFDFLQTVMTSAGELDAKAPYDKIVNNTYAEKAIADIK